jgi:hypothetical protein
MLAALQHAGSSMMQILDVEAHTTQLLPPTTALERLVQDLWKYTHMVKW